MKKLFGVFSKMIYNKRIRSQHMDVLSKQSGVWWAKRLFAMDRLSNQFLAGNMCGMSALAKDWLVARFAE